MLTRIAKARTGRSSIYIDLSLPFKKGTKRAPIINIAAGGIMLIIIVLFSFNEHAQKLSYKNEKDTGNKSIHRKKRWRIFPWKLSVLMNKEVNDKEHYEGYVKTE
jgi:hypothetical protein